MDPLRIHSLAPFERKMRLRTMRLSVMAPLCIILINTGRQTDMISPYDRFLVEHQ
jgi:hypothetical protein